jgi:hypothetical protein
VAEHWSGSGTPVDPWVLKTAPLSSSYTIYLDSSEPALLVCQVGTTKLTYLARAIEDLHRELVRRGEWVMLGAADEQKAASEGSVEAWGRSARFGGIASEAGPGSNEAARTDIPRRGTAGRIFELVGGPGRVSPAPVV